MTLSRRSRSLEGGSPVVLGHKSVLRITCVTRNPIFDRSPPVPLMHCSTPKPIVLPKAVHSQVIPITCTGYPREVIARVAVGLGSANTSKSPGLGDLS